VVTLTHQEEVVMDPGSLIDKTKDALTVKRVFGEPYERNGVTVIPAAASGGGAGGGSGEGGDGENRGSGNGGGFGVAAKPAGAYVIKGDDVRWQPAINVNRVILGGQVVAIVLLLVIRSIVRRG
jgi:uncharacterized spore protein YtfJ